MTTGSALPTLPQSVPRGRSISWLHRFASATACQVACPPVRIRPERPAFGDFYFQAFNGSVSLPVAGYNYNSDWTPLLAGLSPAGMAASFAARSFTTDAFCTRADQCPLLLQKRHYCSAQRRARSEHCEMNSRRFAITVIPPNPSFSKADTVLTRRFGDHGGKSPFARRSSARDDLVKQHGLLVRSTRGGRPSASQRANCSQSPARQMR